MMREHCLFDETLSKLGGTLHPLTVDEKTCFGTVILGLLLLWILWTGIEGTPSSQDLSENPQWAEISVGIWGGGGLFEWSVETFGTVWNLGNCEHIVLQKNMELNKYETLGIESWNIRCLCCVNPSHVELCGPGEDFMVTWCYMNSLFQLNKWEGDNPSWEVFLEKWGALQQVILSMVLKQSDTCHAFFWWSRVSHILSGLRVFIIKVEESPVGWNSDAPKL